MLLESSPGGPHVLTGPVHIEGAAPGDMLEVRVLDVAFRVPYGVNGIGPGSGVLPDLLSARVAPETCRLLRQRDHSQRARRVSRRAFQNQRLTALPLPEVRPRRLRDPSPFFPKAAPCAG